MLGACVYVRTASTEQVCAHSKGSSGVDAHLCVHVRAMLLCLVLLLQPC